MQALLLTTDQQLVEEFKNGNNKALEVLIWRHKEKIFSSILFLVKDKYLAEDIFQDTFIKIIDSIRNDSYTEEGKFLSYAIRVARNMCIDYFRKMKRVQIADAEDNNVFDKIPNSADNMPDNNLIQMQTGDRVNDLVQLLPEDQREVIVLRHFANLSFKEIAEMTNCSINIALGRMRYGLMNMRKILSVKTVCSLRA